MRPLNQCRVFLGARSLAATGGGTSGGFDPSVQTLEIYVDGTR